MSDNRSISPDFAYPLANVCIVVAYPLANVCSVVAYPLANVCSVVAYPLRLWLMFAVLWLIL